MKRQERQDSREPAGHRDRIVGQEVHRMLSKSAAWRSLGPAQQQEIAANTAAIVGTLASGRRGSAGRALGDPYAFPLDVGGPASPPLPPTSTSTSAPTGGGPTAPKVGDTVNAGVDSAARMVSEIDFPTFVASLVEGTFHAIVKSSIEQMQAYADMVKSVAQSLEEFRDENVTQNQGRDQLVSKYPQLFQVNVNNGQPTVGAKPDLPDTMPDFQKDLGLAEPVNDVDDETIENVLVPAARNQLAMERQKLLATIILMGINRIIVTDGKINARIRFQFSATENTATQAQSFDYQNMGTTTTVDQSGQSQNTGMQISSSGAVQGASSYATGQYKSTSTPDVRVTSQVDTSSTGALQASGQIMGEVSINFRSETFPLEKMVDSGQMLQLQQAQRGPGRGVPAAAPGAPALAPAPGAAPAASAPAASPPPAPAPAPA
jgi:hypothetical protein